LKQGKTTVPTYNEYESSRALAAPIELFKFETPAKVYTYTSDFEPHTLLGLTYQPEPISRSNVTQGNSSESVSLELTVPASLPLVAEVAFDYAPPESLELTVYRFHDEDTSNAVTYWKGRVASIQVSGTSAKIVVPSTLTNSLSSSIPGKFYQSPCNHTLFGTRCGVSRAAFTVNTVAASVTNSEIVTTTVPGGGVNYYAGGEIVHPASGERRLIASSNGDRFAINFPFRSVRDGDVLEIVPGCDHSPEACSGKFNNTPNFGGFPFIPSKNVFRDGLQ
jgi:uncharacterized phage protein (TIGR02218 family)